MINGAEDATVEPKEPSRQDKALARTLKNADRVVWDARPELAHIAAYAHARMCSRWAVLGIALSLVACTVPPNVVLPAIVGSYASLNMFVAVVGRSGSGKSAAIAAARSAVVTYGYPMVPLGSGEGITRAYAYRRPKDIELTWVERSVLFTSTEVDAMAALGSRAGATLLPQIREMFNGATLGFGYAAADKRLILPEHSYRAGVVVGVQPGRAGALLDDSDGGTPQRFLWVPGIDITVPRRPDEAPPPWKLQPLHWPPPLEPPSNGDDEDDRPKSKGIGRREVLTVATVAQDAIRDAAHQRATGADDPLDGHALLVRLKVATSLAVLAGRKIVDAADWELANQIMAVSDATRAQVQHQLAATRAAVSERLGHAEGVRAAAASQSRADHDYRRVAGLIDRKLAEGPPGARKYWRRSTMRKVFPARDRETFDAVFDALYFELGDCEFTVGAPS